MVGQNDENGPRLRDNDSKESRGGDEVEIMEAALLEGYTWSGEVVDGDTLAVHLWLRTRLLQAGNRDADMAIGGGVLGLCG